MDHDRPNPDVLLKQYAADEKRMRRGKLRIFLGMSAGVGKTFAMLKAAKARRAEGKRVLIGLVETHGRVETAALLEDIEILPRKSIPYRGARLEEFDIDEMLARRPDLALIDELAHTNVPGSRHQKRYQDVLEILEAGIDVYTTMNVQHLESRKDLVEKITGAPIRETVPDTVFEIADQIEVIDLTPVDLLQRLKEGKVYLADRAARAAENFFKIESLTALREMALRFAAERVDQDLQSFHDRKKSSPWQSNERLLVAVSHSPHSERLIRTTRRIAYNLEAPWVAVHVDTGAKLKDDDHKQLTKNLNLARELKADVISTTDRNVAAALRRVARQKNITQVIVGRPAKRWMTGAIEGGSLLDRLVQDSWEIDVHVIRQDRPPTQGPRRLNVALNFKTGFLPYWNTFWLVVGIALLSGLLEPTVGYQSVGFIFLVGVLGVGRIATLGPTIFAATMGALVWNFFFIPPRLTIAISRPEDLILCTTFFIVALITGTMTNRLRAQEALLREREDRTNTLYEVLKEIASGDKLDQILNRVLDRIGLAVEGRCGALIKNKEGILVSDFEHRFNTSLDEREMAVAQWTFSNRQPAGWSTQTLSESRSLFLPIEGDHEVAGVIVYRSKTGRALTLEQANLLHSVARQLGLSIERQIMRSRAAEADQLHASERLHQTLLNSISHEMRTPLTAILGSATVLADETACYSESTARHLAREVLQAGERLNRVIENLLDMSRLNSGVLTLNLEWHDFADLLGVTLRRLAKPLADRKVVARVADDLPLIRIDYRIFEHALSNLIYNAALYTPPNSTIEISARVRQGLWQIEVADDGPGIPDESLSKIFEKFYRVPGTPSGGTGLGLSIVQNIVELHGGTIRAEKNAPSGVRFVLDFPLEKAPAAPVDLG